MSLELTSHMWELGGLHSVPSRLNVSRPHPPLHVPRYPNSGDKVCELFQGKVLLRPAEQSPFYFWRQILAAKKRNLLK